MTLIAIMKKVCAYRGMDYRVYSNAEIDRIQQRLDIPERDFEDVLHAYGVIYQNPNVDDWAVWHEAGHALTATSEQIAGVHWLGDDKSRDTIDLSENRAVLASLVLAEVFGASERVMRDIIEITWESLIWKGNVYDSIPEEERGDYHQYRAMALAIRG